MKTGVKPVRAATIKDVALEVDLAVSTVSRALTRPSMLRPETVKRVRKAAEKLGYQPNLMARDLKRQSSRIIYVVVPSLLPFYLDVLRGIEDAARELGYMVVMGHTDRHPERESEYLDQVASRRADGVILVSSADAAALLARKQLPPTVIALEPAEGGALPTVSVDHTAAAALATRHLLALGHRKLAHIAGPARSPMARHRREGFLAAMREAGLPTGADVCVQGQSTVESGEAAMRELLARPERPTAVFAATDEMAIGAIRLIRENGLHVPGDISVVGFNDQGIAALIDPPLTTVRVPTSALGYSAMTKLKNVLAGEPYERDEVFPTELVIRATTAPPPD